MAWIKNLEVHVTHACNLTCESCVHFSNQGHKGMLSLEDAEQWYAAWAPRLRLRQFCLLGGEPTLHRDLTEHVRLAARFWAERAKVGLLLVTNGFFLDRHPGLFDAVLETNCQVHLSVHHGSEEYLAKVRDSIDLVNQWGRLGVRTKIRQSHASWYYNYRGVGASMRPFNDGDPEQSWRICHSRDCRQLHQGKLWKCPPVAYLPMQKERHPEMSSEWDQYLNFQALEPDATEAELLAFLNVQAEPCCGMCPAKYRYFEPESPLVPLRTSLQRGDA